MHCKWILAAMLSFSQLTLAENVIPPGTIIPVSLDTGMNAAKLKPGQAIRATVMQDVPGTPIRRRARVVGHVLAASAERDGSARLEIRFDAVQEHGKSIPISASLRALASFMEVEEAQIPEDTSDRGLTPETWTTQQIGGEQVYRGGGPVTSGLTDVGKPTPWGVLVIPRMHPGLPCHGSVGGVDDPQAFWLFSSDACGVYGFDHIRIEHAGRSDPAGTIVLSSKDGKLNLKSGTGLLLRVC